MSDEARGDGHIDSLVLRLDSLDDFFEDSLNSPTSDGRSSRTITEAGFGGGDQVDQNIYDEQTLPILHQSLARTSSTASFQNGFADRVAPGSRDATSSNAMNPGAFKLASSVPRPTLHARSITSPSAPSHFQTNVATYLSDEDYTEEIFSDGDDERITTSGEGSFFLENMIKPLAQGTRTSVRRLTGGRTKDNERIRENLRADRRNMSQPPRSPRVPRVPSLYLQGQKSLSPGEQGI